MRSFLSLRSFPIVTFETVHRAYGDLRQLGALKQTHVTKKANGHHHSDLGNGEPEGPRKKGIWEFESRGVVGRDGIRDREKIAIASETGRNESQLCVRVCACVCVCV